MDKNKCTYKLSTEENDLNSFENKLDNGNGHEFDWVGGVRGRAEASFGGI